MSAMNQAYNLSDTPYGTLLTLPLVLFIMLWLFAIRLYDVAYRTWHDPIGALAWVIAQILWLAIMFAVIVGIPAAIHFSGGMASFIMWVWTMGVALWGVGHITN